MREARGFTLLEMLIVIGITALLVTAAVQAHLGIRRVQERVARGLHRERTAEVFLDRVERELNGTLLVVKPSGVDRLSHPFVFIGEDRFESEADADALRFITRTPARAGPRAFAPGLRMVTYGTYTSQNDVGLELVRQEEALPRGLQKEITLLDGRIALDGIATFRVRYLDEEGEWKEDWDSTDVALLDRIPTEVEVTLALNEKAEDGSTVTGPEHTRSITLPVRPFDLDAMRGEEGATADPNSGAGETAEEKDDAEDGTCVTVAECAARLPSGAIGGLAGFVKRFGTVCYTDYRPNPLDPLLQQHGVTCP
jgi:type II secretion system protein J